MPGFGQIPGRGDTDDTCTKDDDTHLSAVVKVKLGAISTAFKGQATFVERDDDNHRAVLHGAGRDTTGKGNADATITAQLESVTADTTKCVVETDLPYTVEGLARALGVTPRWIRENWIETGLLEVASFGRLEMLVGYQLVPLVERHLACRAASGLPAEKPSRSRSSRERGDHAS